MSNALQQTGWADPLPGPETWRALIAARLRSLDWTPVGADLGPFLEDPREMDNISLETVLRVLEE